MQDWLSNKDYVRAGLGIFVHIMLIIALSVTGAAIIVSVRDRQNNYKPARLDSGNYVLPDGTQIVVK